MSASEFAAAIATLQRTRDDLDAARAAFGWPELESFNWALDHFDALAPDRTALVVASDVRPPRSLTFGELSERSNQVANHLRALGARRGDRILVMLGNVVPLWETVLAATKLGLVVIPTAVLMRSADLADRLERGGVAIVVAEEAATSEFEGLAGGLIRICVGSAPPGWSAFDNAFSEPATFEPDGQTRGSDPLLLYFTSGTTALPKLVEHTHRSYPAGHLSTMYWIGLKPGDVHLNISSPGWAKHAWSSFFAPWTAGATVLTLDYERFDAAPALGALRDHGVSSFCAPPTVWRMIVQADLGERPSALRELCSAGEPLNPEVIDEVARCWGLQIRDGYGQTETTAQIGNPPGQPVKVGAMGRPLPGYEVALLDPDGNHAHEGEVCLPLDPRPAGLMVAYRDSEERTAEAFRDGYYHTGDVARRDADGYLTFVGRTDDVFKSSDYRISPFELESVLIEHPAVVEAAVVPSPDPLRLAVPKAYVVLAAGINPSRETAASILAHCSERLPPFKRVRRVEFADLPKTISGKIRRTELRAAEESRSTARRALEFWEEDLR